MEMAKVHAEQQGTIKRQQATKPELRGLSPDVGLFVTSRFADHQPYYRLEEHLLRIFILALEAASST